MGFPALGFCTGFQSGFRSLFRIMFQGGFRNRFTDYMLWQCEVFSTVRGQTRPRRALLEVGSLPKMSQAQTMQLPCKLGEIRQVEVAASGREQGWI